MREGEGGRGKEKGERDTRHVTYGNKGGKGTRGKERSMCLQVQPSVAKLSMISL